MSKQIQISDSLYKRLKGAADAHYRSLGGEIEFMMDFIGGRNGARAEVSGHGVWLPDNHPANKQPNPTEELHDKVLPDPLYPKKIASEPNGSGVSDLFTKSNLPDNMQLEQPCCANEFKPCKHWVWDINTGDGYRNSLSGRFMEVE